jgi:hypothetical protein
MAGAGDNGAALRRVLNVEDKHERPTTPERKAARSARAASRALDLRHWAAAEGWKDPPKRNWHLLGSCDVCAQHTGCFCDPCADAGVTFVSLHGVAMCGRPICSRCDAAGACIKCATGAVPADGAIDAALVNGLAPAAPIQTLIG